MKEIKIEMSIDDQLNILLKNNEEGLIIDNDSKTINATEIYKFLNYNNDNKYYLKDMNTKEFSSTNYKEFYEQTKEILQELFNSINEVNSAISMEDNKK